MARRTGVEVATRTPGPRRATRYNPQFNAEALQQDLSLGIGYVHVPSLGGFPSARPDSGNVGLTHSGFRGYADYVQTAAFAVAQEQLIELAKGAPAAIMVKSAAATSRASSSRAGAQNRPWSRWSPRPT